MAQWQRVTVVSGLTLGAVALVVFLSATPVGSLTHREAPLSPSGVAAEPIATAPPVITPDLTKVDAHAMLDPIPVGRKAPDFSAIDAAGKPVKLSHYRGKKHVVMVFYQGSFCPVCGRQLENLQRHLNDFNQQDAVILAISADDTAHARKTLGEHGLSFHVIPDPQKALIKKFGVGNIVKQGIAWPAGFIIDKQGVVRYQIADAQGRRPHSSDFLPVLSKLTGKPAPQLSYEQ